MTVASFVIVQALSMCCRIQFCMIHGGVPAIFSVLKSSEVKFPALEGFVLPTDIHVSRGTRLALGVLTLCMQLQGCFRVWMNLGKFWWCVWGCSVGICRNLSILHLLDLVGPVSSSVGLEHLIFYSRSSFSSSLLSNLPFQIFLFRSGRSAIQDGPCLSKLLHSLAVRSPVDLHTARSRLSLRTEWRIICWQLLCCEASDPFQIWSCAGDLARWYCSWTWMLQLF